MNNLIDKSSQDKFTLISLRAALRLDKFKIEGYRFIVAKNNLKYRAIPSGKYDTINFYLIDTSENSQGRALMFYFNKNKKLMVVSKYRFPPAELLNYNYISFLEIPDYFKAFYRDQINLDRAFLNLKKQIPKFFVN